MTYYKGGLEEKTPRLTKFCCSMPTHTNNTYLKKVQKKKTLRLIKLWCSMYTHKQDIERGFRRKNTQIDWALVFHGCTHKQDILEEGLEEKTPRLSRLCYSMLMHTNKTNQMKVQKKKHDQDRPKTHRLIELQYFVLAHTNQKNQKKV